MKQYSQADMDIADFRRRVERDGFAAVPSCLDGETIERLCFELSDTAHAMRNLLAMSIVRELASSVPVRKLAETVLGKDCFAVNATFFNKTPASNWKVAWHQDLTIMVCERREVPGFNPWTIKSGIVHVQPPTDVMTRILAVRLHLDESGLENGALRVVPGSHKQGRLSPEAVALWQMTGYATCAIPRGGALLMRPLLLHASSSSAVPKPRRVIHLEFAAEELPGGLEWYWRS